MILKYVPVKNTYYDDTEFVRYGIAALDVSERPAIVLRTAADLTSDAFTALALADKCNRENVSFCEMSAVIEDFISETK